MSYDHFRPPEHFSTVGKVLFRLLCLVTVVIGIVLLAYFVAPIVNSHIGKPLGDLTCHQVAAWTGETCNP